MASLRFFLAHPKSYDDAMLEEVARVAHQILARYSGGKDFELVLGRDYFAARFSACGSWNAWTREVAVGVQYLTREPIFRAILVPAGPVGAGTARIVAEALAVNKTVVAFNKKALCRRVLAVAAYDAQDFKTGFRLILEDPTTSGSLSTSSPHSPMPI